MSEENKNVALWPGEPPPPYGKEGEKAWKEWEEKADTFWETVESWQKENK